MHNKVKEIIVFSIVIIWATVSFAQRYFPWTDTLFWLVGGGMLVVNFFLFYINHKLSFSSIYVSLIHFTKYINEWFTELIGANFNGVFFLIPTLIFTICLLLYSTKVTKIDWWRKEELSYSLWWQTSLAVAVGTLAMYWYMDANEHTLTRFLSMLPQGSVVNIVAMGIAFALLNGVVEEYMIR